MTLQKVLWKSTIALICVELGLALAYLTMIFRQGEVAALFDFDGLRSLPSLLQAAHLFTIGGLCLLLLVLRRQMVRPCSWFLPSAVATLCFYACLDELTKLHIMLDQFNWKLIYLGLLIGIPLLGWRDLVWAWLHHRTTVLWVGMGLGVFLMGGFGAEMLKGVIASGLSAHSSDKVVFLSEHLRITVEEFAELLGETLMLYAFAQFTLETLQLSKQRAI
ncbi:hypothetical protein PN498_17080 [Oscillatoria sp. CS-180]|uniref:hypothetical protein n=1 Tax=Oscillatoria sp. CS-180 TaxID=3021720 RepID=UPI00232B7821|nr:hypothetical protein [Oscillatoria sp. CS-180]MDB9527711.1 hypothetical protein [Oscillatoria sp. CS-180]